MNGSFFTCFHLLSTAVSVMTGFCETPDTFHTASLCIFCVIFLCAPRGDIPVGRRQMKTILLVSHRQLPFIRQLHVLCILPALRQLVVVKIALRKPRLFLPGIALLPLLLKVRVIKNISSANPARISMSKKAVVISIIFLSPLTTSQLIRNTQPNGSVHRQTLIDAYPQNPFSPTRIKRAEDLITLK